MSNWIHVNAAIRIDDLRLDDSVPDFDELVGKECLIDSPESVWDDMKLNPNLYLPMGSEGSLQKSICITPGKCDMAACSVLIFGDLRDCNKEDAEGVIEWFKNRCNQINKTDGIRHAVITVRVNTDKPIIFVYDPFEKYRNEEDGESHTCKNCKFNSLDATMIEPCFKCNTSYKSWEPIEEA